MVDYWDECFSPQMGMPPKQFEQTFCRICRNPECERSALTGSRWQRRMSTQADRLLDHPSFADPNDPKFKDIRALDFPDAMREAIRLEITDRRGDWETPTTADVVKYAAEMAARVAPEPPTEPSVEAPPDEPLGTVLKSFNVRGSQGDTYTVTVSEVIVGQPPVWRCNCKAFEFGRARPCKHIEYAVIIPEESEEVPLPPPPKPTKPPPRFQAAPPPQAPPPQPARKPQPFLPPSGNIPMPSGGIMLDGTRPKPAERPAKAPEVDPWAPKPAKEPTVPVHGKVVLGGKKP